MILSILWSLTKIVLLSVLLIALYFANRLFIKPFLFRRRYKKYSNVYVTEDYDVLLGDIKPMIDAVKDNKVFTYPMRQLQDKVNHYDLRAEMRGPIQLLTIMSHKALKEAVSQEPHAIDRANVDQRDELLLGALKMADGAFSNFPSKPKTMDRRRSYFKILGLNAASKHIPLMLREISKVGELKGEVEMLKTINTCTNKIMMTIMFGRDVEHLLDHHYDYLKVDGSIEKVDISEFFSRVGHDFSCEATAPLTMYFPYIAKTNFFGEYKRNYINGQKFYSAVRHILSQSKDEESLWNQISNLKQFTEEEIFKDIIFLLSGGSTTTAHTLVSLLYFLKKTPKVADRLKEELAAIGITKGCNLSEKFTIDNLQTCDYLYNVIKECFRMDPAVWSSLFYEAYKPTEICGVPIDKGQILRFEVVGPSYNEEEWLEPARFEPDRHDTESEFFKKSELLGKIQNSYSKRTFNHGPRSCPGMTFAQLELKALLSWFITNVDYEVPKDLLENDGARFSLGSHFTPKFNFL